MELGDLVAWIALLVGIGTFLHNEHREKLRHVTSLSIFESWATGELTEENHSRILIRNDGTHAVIVRSVGVAYGELWTFNRNKPCGWSVVALPLESSRALLEPGGKLSFDSPDPLNLMGLIGPVVTFVDANGKTWQKTATSIVQLEKRSWKPRRRDLWFERRPWFNQVNAKLIQRALRSSEKRPGGFPWLALLIDFAWGWRLGKANTGTQPLNAPVGWRYCVTGWTVPQDVDLRPRYRWKEEKEEF